MFVRSYLCLWCTVDSHRLCMNSWITIYHVYGTGTPESPSVQTLPAELFLTSFDTDENYQGCWMVYAMGIRKKPVWSTLPLKRI